MMRMLSFLLIPRSLIRVALRYLRARPWQSGLMVVGIMLGVAVVVGVDLANESARRAFDLSTAALTGNATHTISSGSQGFEEQVYIDLRRSGLEIPAAPMVTAYITSPQLGGETLQMLGVDPFVEAPFRNYLGNGQVTSGGALTRFLTQPGGMMVSQDQATKYGLQLDTVIEVEYAGNVVAGTLIGYLETSDSLTRRALNGLILMDIATAQEITGKIGRLDRVDLILPEDDWDLFHDVQSRLPEDLLLLPAADRDGIVREMSQAFLVNLTAMSLLAMVVALFLIYNTMTFSVMQRWSLFGILRSLGATRQEIFVMVVAEALGMGLLGGLLGTLVGILIGAMAIQPHVVM